MISVVCKDFYESSNDGLKEQVDFLASQAFEPEEIFFDQKKSQTPDQEPERTPRPLFTSESQFPPAPQHGFHPHHNFGSNPG